MNDHNIANKAIVLKLNAKWKAIHVALVSQTICDLMNGVVKAMDIRYATNEDGSPNFDKQEYINPVGWDEWVKLEIRPWDLVIHSAHMSIRVPTVVVTAKYDKVRFKKIRPNDKPQREILFQRDNGIDIYTGKKISFEEATIDHILPKSRGGKDTYENTGLTTKETNNQKGNSLNSEVGLKLHVKPSVPKPMIVEIQTIRHHDWQPFVDANKKKK